jgi:hypothetical protein
MRWRAYLRPRMAMASLRSIFALKPPFAHCSPIPLPPKKPLLRSCRPATAAIMAPIPMTIGVAMKGNTVYGQAGTVSVNSRKHCGLCHPSLPSMGVNVAIFVPKSDTMARIAHRSLWSHRERIRYPTEEASMGDLKHGYVAVMLTSSAASVL